MPEGYSQGNHYQNYEITSPGHKAKYAFFLVQGQQSVQIFICNFQETKVMNWHSYCKTNGIENSLFTDFKIRQPRNGVPDKHNPYTTPHQPGQKNQNSFINCRCIFSQIHTILIMFCKPEWLNFNFFPYSTRDVRFFLQHFVERLTIGILINDH